MRLRSRRRFCLPNPKRIDRPRHCRLNPDAEVMRSVLHGYHARGVHVLLGEPEMAVTATITSQLSGGPSALFGIALDEPLEQDEYECALDLREGAARPVFEQAAREGRLDDENRLRRMTVPWGYITLDINRTGRGSLAEYQTIDPRHVSSMRDIPVRIVGVQPTVRDYEGNYVVNCELFEPLPFWLLPPATHFDSMQPGFHSKTVYFIPSVVLSMIRAQGREDETLAWLGPMGEGIDLGHGQTVYPLKDPKPYDVLAQRVRYLKANTALMPLYFIAPILWLPPYNRKPLGWFRPMREDLAKGIEMEVWQGAEWLEGLE